MDSNEVKLHFLDYWRVIRVRWGLIALVFFMVLVSAGVTVTFLPKEYFAKVSMEVRPDESKFNPLTGAILQEVVDVVVILNALRAHLDKTTQPA